MSKKRARQRTKNVPPNRLHSANPVVATRIQTPPSAHGVNDAADDAQSRAVNSAVFPPAATETVGTIVADGPQWQLVGDVTESVPPPPVKRASNRPAARQASARSETTMDDVATSAPPVAFDDDESHPAFFGKSEDEVHEEFSRREAPDLFQDEPTTVPQTHRRISSKRARSIVGGVLASAAIVVIVALVQRINPSHSQAGRVAPASVVVAAGPAQRAPVQVAEAQVLPPIAPNAEAVATKSSGPDPIAAVVAPVAPVASGVSDSKLRGDEAGKPVVAATVAPAPRPSPAAAHPSPATTEDIDSLSGGQLLTRARNALTSGNMSRASSLAQRAISKGAGGSAYYILGAASQQMGASGSAKNAYAACAKSGCTEASECASIAESL